MKKLLYILLFIPILGFSQTDTTVSILSIDFENLNLGQFLSDTVNKYYDVKYESWVNDSTCTIVDSVGLDGSSRMIQYKFPTGTDEGQTGMEVGIDLGDDYDEVYLSYQIKFTSETEWGYGGYKIPGILGFPIWAGLEPPENNEGFVAHIFPNQIREIEMYSYHHDQAGQYGDITSCEPFRFQNNRWYTITERVVMNSFTVGVSDDNGICELFVNGINIGGRETFEWMENDHDTMGIDGLWWSIFIANNGENIFATSYALIDNIEIYYLDENFASSEGYAWGIGDANSPGDVVYVPIELGSNTDMPDSIYTDTLWTFKDLNGIGNYDNKNDEFHRIYCAGADSIVITVDSCYIEDGYDVFQIINDNTSVTHNYLYHDQADISPGTEYTVYGDAAIIRLGSDYSQTDKGFQISYHAYGTGDESTYILLKGGVDVTDQTYKKGVLKTFKTK